MIWVDYREGSKQLIEPLRKLGLPVEKTVLEFGDIAFIGKGPSNTAVTIGVEFKTVSELVQSLRTERLQGHQLPGMRGTSEQPGPYDYVWLLVEGEVLFDGQGRLLRRAGRRNKRPLGGGMGVAEFHKRLLGLTLRGGLFPVITASRAETLRWLEALYRTWTDTAWDDHTSHLGIYQAAPLLPVSETCAAMAAWPGVGYKVARAAEVAFGSVASAVDTPVRMWAELKTVDSHGKTRKVGLKTAARIVNFLRG